MDDGGFERTPWTSLGSCSKKASGAWRSSDWRGQARLEVPAPARVALAPPAQRRVYIRKEDVNKYGSTAGCPGCTCVLMDEPTVVPHTEACRVRIMELMQGDKQGRARLEAYEKRKKRRQGTTEGAVAPVVERDVEAHEAIGGPGQGPATEEEPPAFPENPEERIELKRSVAERATSSK